MNCSVIGATGYTGIELIKILVKHPNVQISQLTTRQSESISVRTLIPSLSKDIDLKIETYDFNKVKNTSDIIFVCLPHTEAMHCVKEFHDAGKIIIDLSADYRLKKASLYPVWYKTKHAYPKLLKKAIYGLTEINRDLIKKADLIANPGCYPTGAALGLIPLLKNGLVYQDDIVIDSKSGVSGAGKKLTTATQFAELDENFYAYKVNQHQHSPEITQMLETVSGEKVSLTFVPHLLPINRGILSVMYLKMRPGVTEKQIENAFKQCYEKEPFIRVKPQEQFPELRHVQYTNFCDIGFVADKKTGRVIVITAIDNLMKGASGQAIQNMNVRCGFAEEEGLI